ncbi:hypothetical protein [Mycobacterium leprae]|uniref:hypothetical protein n=1 Tax=Mycobacterium leprae TaxID=1769 RepID=UPI00059C5F51|nr:hypothetical protein A8144_05600 [Mycobacterium leprae 3125609]OAX71429.1 hypothetical protein A3216_05745 [Mycobacterium leprae 7935681]
MPASSRGLVVKVVEAAGTGNEAFGLWVSTFVFNRFISFIRSSLRLSSSIDYTLLLTSAN